MMPIRTAIGSRAIRLPHYPGPPHTDPGQPSGCQRPHSQVCAAIGVNRQRALAISQPFQGFLRCQQQGFGIRFTVDPETARVRNPAKPAGYPFFLQYMQRGMFKRMVAAHPVG